jgi:hypothetical protein
MGTVAPVTSLRPTPGELLRILEEAGLEPGSLELRTIESGELKESDLAQLLRSIEDLDDLPFPLLFEDRTVGNLVNHLVMNLARERSAASTPLDDARLVASCTGPASLYSYFEDFLGYAPRVPGLARALAADASVRVAPHFDALRSDYSFMECYLAGLRADLATAMAGPMPSAHVSRALLELTAALPVDDRHLVQVGLTALDEDDATLFRVEPEPVGEGSWFELVVTLNPSPVLDFVVVSTLELEVLTRTGTVVSHCPLKDGDTDAVLETTIGLIGDDLSLPEALAAARALEV